MSFTQYIHILADPSFKCISIGFELSTLFDCFGIISGNGGIINDGKFASGGNECVFGIVIGGIDSVPNW